MKRYDILNKLIEKYNYKTYVEIGVQKGASYNSVKIESKIGVDPDPKAGATFTMTSDTFFAGVSKKNKINLYFIDGEHTHQQAYRDITNSLEHLSDNGTILVHDTNPPDEDSQKVPRIQKHWNGDVWKAIVQLRTERDDLEIFTIDTDEGCTIIRKGKNELLEIKGKLTYQNLEKNRKEWLNLISVEDWLISMGENMSYKIWEFIPYGIEDRNYGRSCNEYCELVQNDDDWIVIRDTDCCSLTPAHMHVIKNAIENAPNDTGMLIPWSSRIGQKRQVYDMKHFDDPNMINHRKIALELVKQPLKYTEFNIPISGMIMIFKKSIWKKVNGFRDGLLGVDTTFSNRIRRSELKIYLVNQLYFMHYYRLLEGDKFKQHLK
jgi:hypothetical protein